MVQMKKLICLLLLPTIALAAKMPAKHLRLTVNNMPQCQWLRVDASHVTVIANGDVFISKVAPVYYGTDTRDSGAGLHTPIFVYKSPGDKIYLRLPPKVMWDDTSYDKPPENYLPVDSIEED